MVCQQSVEMCMLMSVECSGVWVYMSMSLIPPKCLGSLISPSMATREFPFLFGFTFSGVSSSQRRTSSGLQRDPVSLGDQPASPAVSRWPCKTGAQKIQSVVTTKGVLNCQQSNLHQRPKTERSTTKTTGRQMERDDLQTRRAPLLTGENYCNEMKRHNIWIKDLLKRGPQLETHKPKEKHK